MQQAAPAIATRQAWLQACAEVFQAEGNLSQEDAQIAAGTAWQLAGSRLDSDPAEAARTLIPMRGKPRLSRRGRIAPCR